MTLFLILPQKEKPKLRKGYDSLSLEGLQQSLWWTSARVPEFGRLFGDSLVEARSKRGQKPGEKGTMRFVDIFGQTLQQDTEDLRIKWDFDCKWYCFSIYRICWNKNLSSGNIALICIYLPWVVGPAIRYVRIQTFILLQHDTSIAAYFILRSPLMFTKQYMLQNF